LLRRSSTDLLALWQQYQNMIPNFTWEFELRRKSEQVGGGAAKPGQRPSKDCAELGCPKERSFLRIRTLLCGHFSDIGSIEPH